MFIFCIVHGICTIFFISVFQQYYQKCKKNCSSLTENGTYTAKKHRTITDITHLYLLDSMSCVLVVLVFYYSGQTCNVSWKICSYIGGYFSAGSLQWLQSMKYFSKVHRVLVGIFCSIFSLLNGKMQYEILHVLFLYELPRFYKGMFGNEKQLSQATNWCVV